MKQPSIYVQTVAILVIILIVKIITQPQTSNTSISKASLDNSTYILDSSKEMSTEISMITSNTPNLTDTVSLTQTTVTSTNSYQFSSSDVDLIERVVMREAGGCSEEGIMAVTNVILNRLKSNEFPNTIKEIIYQPDQFYTANTSIQPTNEVITAVHKALNGYDNSKGALYYYAPKYVHNKQTIRWFESLTFLFELDGHRFFK